METLLMSGGLDSFCLWWVAHKPVALYIGGEFGPAREANEGEINALDVARKLCPEFNQKFRAIFIDFTPFMRAERWTFPRESILAMLAWSHGSNKVLYGYTKNDLLNLVSIDRQIEKLQGAVDDPAFKVAYPVWHHSKAELVSQAIAMGAPTAFIEASHSCVLSSKGHCGNCFNCCERFIAFRVAGVPDSDYQTNPLKSKAMRDLEAKHRNSDWWQRQRKVAEYANRV